MTPQPAETQVVKEIYALERLAKLVGEGLDNRIAAGNEPVFGSQVDIFSFLGPMRPEKARFRTNDGHASTGPA